MRKESSFYMVSDDNETVLGFIEVKDPDSLFKDCLETETDEWDPSRSDYMSILSQSMNVKYDYTTLPHEIPKHAVCA